MEKILCRILLVTMFVVAACSSPEKQGEKMAQRLNECAEEYFSGLQQAETDFVSHFDASDYASRTEALEAYRSTIDKVKADYDASCDEIEVQRSKVAGSLSKDYAKLTAFQKSFEANVDYDLAMKVMYATADTIYPDAVLAKVKAVVPVRPNVAQIQKDLVGHQLNEGFDEDKCWFPRSWRWKIQEGEIKNFQIEEVLCDNAEEYTFVVSMRLEGEYNSFDARAKVSYRLPEAEDWKLDYVNSLGMTIVKTHRYDNMVTLKISDGWLIQSLLIYNNSELDLWVGVEVVESGSRERHSVRVGPGSQQSIGYSVSSYSLAFVEKY